jgi:zinc protease
MKTLQFVCALIVCAAVALSAQTLPSGVKKMSSMGGITEYDYPNGLKVLLYPDPAEPKITINVTYLVGSRHEGYGETGMAHLLEHMDFIETTTGRKIKNEITAHASNWNGTTNDDRTNYYETISSADDNLQWALGLEADRMVNVKFTKELLDTEMTVVRNEFERGENNPGSILRERVASTAYLWHNYGKSTIGSKEDIERVPVNRLAEFYKKFYQPDNAVVTITGRIDDTKTLQLVADTLGKIPRPSRVLDQTYTVEPPQDGERFVALRRVGQGQDLVVAYHTVSASHPDAAAVQVLAGVMSGGGGGGRGGRGGGGGAAEGRLAKALVAPKLAESASMGFQQRHDPGLIEVSATLNQDQSLDAARDAVFKALQDVVATPPTDSEVDRVKTQMLRGLENNLSNPQAIATGALNTAIAQGDWRLMFLQHDELAKVTPADVVRVARTYLKPSNRTVGYYVPDPNPDRTIVADAPDLAGALRDYKSTVTVARAESFDPTIPNIESRVVRSKLANGMKVDVLSKKTANNIVTATIELRFGDATTLAGKRDAATFASTLLMAGTKQHTQQQIRDEMRRLNAQINVGGAFAAGGRGGGRGGAGAGALQSVTASVSAPAENFAAALNLAAEILREPLYSSTEYDRARDQRIKALELTPTEPTQLASDQLTRHMSPFSNTDAQYVPTREEELAGMKNTTLEAARAFHTQFYGADHGILAVVGPVEPAAVQKQAVDLFGTWKSKVAYKPLVTPYKKVAAINEKIETPDKANAEFMAQARFQLSQNDPDYPAIVLASYMFGEPITSRISDRIRNREGLSYGANARLVVPAEGDAALLTGTVSLNPGFGPKVEASFMDELRKVYKDGFTQAEVENAKRALLDARLVGRSTDAALLTFMVQHEQLDRPFKWDADVEAKIRSLTADDVNAAFRRHIDPNNVSIVKAGDFKAAGVYK